MIKSKKKKNGKRKNEGARFSKLHILLIQLKVKEKNVIQGN